MPLDGRPLPTGLGQGVHVYVLDTGASPEGIRIARLPEHSGDFVGDAWGTQHGSADCHGHGSHVAGIVAGTEAGVASGATLYALRVTDCEGRGRPEAVIAAMNWLSKHARRPAVAVLSVQYRGVEAVGHAAARLVEQGVVTVAAAGGSLENACEHMPSGTPGVITVAGTTPEDHALAHSNWGPCVDVWAPGSNIHSLPAKGDKLVPKSGSSAAAAYVAGAAAIYLAKHPQAEPAAVRAAIQKAATPARVSMQRSKFAQATRRDLLFIPPSWYE